ncbi:MAG: gamma-glutamyl-gamma-aminobutyrate hydrolase family protein [Actinomycetota bacterium]|nr:gamma-glutamyl-gamma-aminobutyrate hydrolase family protein [Actinomycetota bacterium]
MRPVIGITVAVEDARWGVWSDRVSLVPAAYTDAVVAAGGLPVLLPPVPDPVAALDLVDALVLSGGSDISPERYGAAPSDRTTGVQEEQDAAELALLTRALETGLPVLAVCRGLQLLAVLRGGTLHQHLPDVPEHSTHGAHGGDWSEHVVDLVPGTTVRRVLGADRLAVNSGHHQGIADVADLVVSARSPDGLVEAAEVAGHRFAVGVQWHPEMIGQAPLFTALVDAARATEPTP